MRFCDNQLADRVATLFSDILDDEVNNKPTKYIVRGSDPVGYSWYVDWYDEIYTHHLHCGNEKFSSELMDRVLELAVRLDNIG